MGEVMPEPEHKLYKERPEWADVKPIYNSSDEDSAMRIAFKPDVEDAFAYLRAVMTSGEVSKRAFDLTTDCTQINAANYSLWEYRRRLISLLGIDLNDELEFCEMCITENPKNYQVWHHRKELISLIKPKNVDFEFVDGLLADDQKNYHAWQHRVFLAKTFRPPLEGELRTTTWYINNDAYNNSAWSYRFFLISEISNNFDNEQVLAEEIQFAINLICAAYNNESSWSYLTGLMDFSSYTDHPEVIRFARKASGLAEEAVSVAEDTEALKKSPHHPFAISFLADALITTVKDGKGDQNGLDLAKACYERLATIDPIRRKFWAYKVGEIANIAPVPTPR